MSGETATMNTKNVNANLKPFTFDKPLYNLDSYIGRFKNQWASTNPILFLVSGKTIKKSVDTLAHYKALEQKAKAKGEQLMLSKSQIDDIYYCDSVVRSSVHPDTGHTIPCYMRFTAYVYANVPINFGLLCTAPTNFNIILWQWINQTYYVGVNYANRNASSTFTNKDLLIAYFGAVVASIGAGIAVRRSITPFKKFFTGTKALLFTFIISGIANSAANGSNLLIIRSKEMKNGIPLKTESGEEVGISLKAGRSAVLQTALTRCMMPILPLGVPTLIFYYLGKWNMIAKNNKLKILQQAIVYTISLMYAPAVG